jgi:hypothetical protein
MATNPPDRQTSTSRVSHREETMRAIGCPCGHRFDGANDWKLFRVCRAGAGREHPEMKRSDERLRERIVTGAYENCGGLMGSAARGYARTRTSVRVCSGGG